jgi:ABC-type sugar transport system ATPase subunit
MGRVLLEGISKNFGATEVLKNIDLDVIDGEFAVIVGPSGCGKSTLLRIIAGLEDQTEGRVVIGDRDVSVMPPSKRGIAMVFQSYALYPHLTVERNMTLGLRQARTAAEVISQRLAEAVRILELAPFLRRKPAQLSGGQRQRVAIGRAIMRQPEVFLFDEPLSNLDAALRSQVRFEIADLHRRLKSTMIYVTHDQIEAMTLADRIVVVNAGVVQQIGTPAELYRTPANTFVATFIGSPRMNILAGRVMGGRVAIESVGDLAAGDAAAGAVTVGVRPDGFETTRAGDGEGLAGVLIGQEYLGSESFLHVRLNNDAMVVVREHPDHGWKAGQQVTLRLRPGSLHLFDPQSGLRVSAGPADAARIVHDAPP